MLGFGVVLSLKNKVKTVLTWYTVMKQVHFVDEVIANQFTLMMGSSLLDFIISAQFSAQVVLLLFNNFYC